MNTYAMSVDLMVDPFDVEPVERHDECRKTCAARRNPNAECVCAELDELGW